MTGRARIAVGLIVVCLAGSGVPSVAFAATCTVDGAAAYARAKDRGWIFHCTRAVPETDGVGRIGCVARTGLGKRLRGSIDFFQKGTTAFLNGWTLQSFELTGETWTPLAPSAALGVIQARFSVRGSWTVARYFLTSVTLEKPGGRCDDALREAF